MATKMDKDLFDRMRSLGVRKSRAKEVAGAVRNSSGAAPKAARTRKQKAKARSQSAKKAARTRAKA